MSDEREIEIERLAALAQVGARRAADAFAQLVDQPIWVSEAVVIDGAAETDIVLDNPEDSSWSTGVFFEFEGCLDGLVGILFPGAASESLVRRIVGIESGELAPPVIESALMEVGNILASHVASGIADALESRLLPSIPSLAMAGAEGAFQELIENVVGRGALRIESAFNDSSGSGCGRLVLVPTRLESLRPAEPESDSPHL